MQKRTVGNMDANTAINGEPADMIDVFEVPGTIQGTPVVDKHNSYGLLILYKDKTTQALKLVLIGKEDQPINLTGDINPALKPNTTIMNFFQPGGHSDFLFFIKEGGAYIYRLKVDLVQDTYMMDRLLRLDNDKAIRATQIISNTLHGSPLHTAFRYMTSLTDKSYGAIHLVNSNNIYTILKSDVEVSLNTLSDQCISNMHIINEKYIYALTDNAKEKEAGFKMY